MALSILNVSRMSPSGNEWAAVNCCGPDLYYVRSSLCITSSRLARDANVVLVDQCLWIAVADAPGVLYEADGRLSACLSSRNEFVVCQMKISMSSDQTGEAARGRLSGGDLVPKDSLRHLDDEVNE